MAGKANPKFQEALAFAAQAHAAVNQERKGTDFPYIVHPIRVAEILDRFDCGDDVVVAGFLHDTIEDAGVTRDDLVQRFGSDVADLVVEVTDDKSLPKKERKRLQVENARKKSVRAQMIKPAGGLGFPKEAGVF